MIWVIFAVALALGAAVTAFLQYLEVQTHKELIKKAQDEQKVAEDERKFATFRQIKAICRLVGYPFDNETETEKVIGLIRERVDVTKAKYWPAPNTPGKAMAMWEVIRAAEINYIEAFNRLQTAKQFKKDADSNSAMAVQAVSEYARVKDAEIAELQAILTKVTELQTEDVRRYELRKSTLEQESQKLSQAKTDLEKANKGELLDLSNKFNSVDTRLRELVKQEAIFHDLTEAQGRIVDPHQDERFAFITLGERDRLVRGLKFIVFQREPGGNVHWKGEVEVKEIFPMSAKVSITETVDRFEPIIEGDVIYNPLYHPSRPKKIAFAGDFGKTKYGKEAATARIRNIGSIVQDQVSFDTDFLIVGDSYQTDANYERAGLLSVPWRPHFEAYRFLGD
jgi:NAD-dependent DNA ligase